MEELAALGIKFQPGSVPMWGTFLLMLGVIGKLWLQNRKIDVDSEGGIRDHYAKELARLTAQMTETQELADARLANAEKRYTEAVEAADRRHKSCEEECDRLRTKVYGLERQLAQLHKSTIKMFEPRADLDEETKARMRSMEQPPVQGTGRLRRGRRT